MNARDRSPSSEIRGLSRRRLLQSSLAAAGLFFLPRFSWAQANPSTTSPAAAGMDSALAADWLKRWHKNILPDLSTSKPRYCDKEMGEELGWLVSPYLNAFYYGYLATGDDKWVAYLIDWSDAWIARGIKEPDGFIGWPKDDGTSTAVIPDLYTDNMLGEAMALHPAVLMANLINKTPALKARYADKAKSYIDIAEKVFAKWDARGCWRSLKTGGIWVVPEFGIDKKNNRWTDGYDRRATTGFSLPANKNNLIACWLLALADATSKPLYRERAEKWFQAMKSRIRPHEVGGAKYLVWNYWDPAGPWDYKPNGDTRHWVGVHPNGGYYGIDLEGIVTAYEHKLVFDKQDIDRLLATNRDYMWDKNIKAAKFQRIDGGKPDPHWKDTPGILWTALLPYDPTLRKIFEANHKPDSWGGMTETPRYIDESHHGWHADPKTP